MIRFAVSSDGKYIQFKCPGCKSLKNLPVASGNKKRDWNWNGNREMPTLQPSILVTVFSSPKRICHSYVTDGRIQFLNDCTHDLKGQTVDLQEYSEWY